MKLSYNDYRSACEYGYVANVSNPTLFWNPCDGFYVKSGLIPNHDLSLGLIHYCHDERSHRGTRSEYYPVGRTIRKYHGTVTVEALKEKISEAIHIHGMDVTA